MGYLYYIQGVHPVRVELDSNGDWDEVERYDLQRRNFVSDWSMSKRISDDMDCQKISPIRFWEYIALLHTNRPRKGGAKSRRPDYRYYIQGFFAVRVRLDLEGLPLYCERYDAYQKKFVNHNIIVDRLEDTSCFTKMNVASFWLFVAKSRNYLFSPN